MRQYEVLASITQAVTYISQKFLLSSVLSEVTVALD